MHSIEFISCYLTHLKYLLSYKAYQISIGPKEYTSTSKLLEAEKKISHRDINLHSNEENNFIIIRNHCVDFFYFLNDNEQYIKAKGFLEECKLDPIFIVILLKKYLYSPNIESILEYILINEKLPSKICKPYDLLYAFIFRNAVGSNRAKCTCISVLILK